MADTKNEPDESPAPDLDIQKLHALPSEQQELFLLTFTAEVLRFVSGLSGDQVSSQQADIKKTLLRVLSLHTPAPTRVIRKNVGASFAILFERGNRKLLFESINDLVALVAVGNKDRETATRHAAIYCLGTVYEAAGDSAINLSSLVVSSLLKILKSSANHVGLRGTIFTAFGCIFKGIGNGADEGLAREVWRQARTALAGEKSTLVQIRAAQCLEAMMRHVDYFNNSNDYDRLQASLFKAFEVNSASLRSAAASCWSCALVISYSEQPIVEDVARLRKPKRKGTKIEDEDDAIERPDSPAPSKTATRLSFDLSGILAQMNLQYTKTTTSNRARAAIAICYVKTMKGLDAAVIEANYGLIASGLFYGLLSVTTISNHRYRTLFTRQVVRIVLEQTVGSAILRESAQLRAVRFLLNDILKDYPQALKERPEPSKIVLTAALSALASFITSLGDAITPIAEFCRETLLQVLVHPSYTVQVGTAYCLKAFALACPQHLLSCVTICTNGLTRELSQLSSGRQASRRCLGLANGLAAVLSGSPYQPLYGSVDVFARVMSLATSLLKSSSSSDLRVSSTQIQIAWILLGGLMSLGPNFVKIHTSQLLLLWKNALPKPLGKDHMSQRTILELSFLTHVRDCALGSILTFLDYNRRLLTVDVTKRIASMLYNTIAFLATLPSRKTSDEVAQRLSPSLQLSDYDLMVRRRTLQCLSRLIVDAPPGSNDLTSQPNLLPMIISSFAAPDNYNSSNTVGAAIASSTGAYDSIWDVGDNHGFGVTSLVRGFDVSPFPGETSLQVSVSWLSDKSAYADIEQLLLSPIGTGREYDAVRLYSKEEDFLNTSSRPPATEVVNNAIQLFALLFPSQPTKVQESVIQQLQTYVTESSTNRDQIRREAVTINTAVAILGALKVALSESSHASGELRSEATHNHIKLLLHSFLINQDQFVRSLAAQSIGRLARVAGSTFTVRNVDELIELIVSNREPSARSGSAMALGQVHSQLGGMAAGLHLKKILGVLNSLSSDPHPTVHFWALDSISRLSSSAGLNFAPYVTGTLGLLAQLYYSDSHSEEVGSLAWSNLEVDLPTPSALVRCVGSIIDVLGPDLQEMSKTRDLVMLLIDRLGTELSPTSQVESLRCLEHLSLYAPNHLDFVSYVRQLQSAVESQVPEVRHAALEGLYNLMRRDTDEVLAGAQPGLEERLWLVLDDDPREDIVKKIIWNWLQQTGTKQAEQWIVRCNAILMKVATKTAASNVPSDKPKKADDFQDEEVAGFAAAPSGRNDEIAEAGSVQELLRWQTRTFAMSVLSELIRMVVRDSAQNVHSKAEDDLQSKVADVIRIAFSASTTGAIALRIVGLQIINQILRLFSETPDPEYPDVPLLQQHQAQISSALNPAFGHDSSPELAAEAVNVCATFVAAGIVTEIKQMTRILSLLSSSLDSFSGEADNASIGELYGLSSNAAVMVKMAIYSAWAELQVASSERKYLADALQPRIAKLTPLWLASLQEHARLRFEPDISTAAGTVMSQDLDTVYAALNRETLLQFYQASWLKLVEAVASLIDENSEFVFDALDGKTGPSKVTNGHTTKESIIPYRNEPVAFFFVLFGLAFEALVGRSGDNKGAQRQTLDILNALKKILRPAVSGNAIYQEAIFSETMDMLDRLVLTEPLSVQFVIVQIARNLCLEHPSARTDASEPVEEERLSDDIEQLFELTRIIVLVVAGLVPNLTDDQSRARHPLNDEAVALLGLALNALVDASAVFPSVIETDLHACIIHIFATILSTPACQAAVVPQSLPVMKRFLTTIASKPTPRAETTAQIRTALARFLTILKHAQRREMEHAISCEKNALFASTILFSTASTLLSARDPLIQHLASELADCLNSRIPSKIAATCAHSVMLASKRTPADDAFAAAMLPHLLNFVGEQADVEGLDEARDVAARTLSALVAAAAVAGHEGEKRTTLLTALVLPTLLGRARNAGVASYKDVAERVLECAAANQLAFRGVVAGLESGSRALLEDVIRIGGGVRKEARETRDEPSIALKMDFGR